MIFPLNIIKKVNNGILSLSNYFNGFSDNNQPIEFATTLKEIFELYKTDYQYRTEKNKCYLMDISSDLLCFEYTIDKNKVWYLEGTDNEPNDLQQYMGTYVDAYNVCCDIHDYFEKLYPNEFYSLDSEQPIILTGADYDYNPPQPIIKPLLEKININTLPDGIYNRLARLDTNYGELILPDISYFSDLDFYLLCEWYDSFKRNIKSDKGLYNEKGEKLTLQYDSYKYLFIEFGKGFKKGYSEFENDLKPKTKLFEQDNNQIAFKVFSHVDTYFNVGSFSFNINIDNENMPQYSRYVTPETMFNNGLEWGKQYKAWTIILDNIPLFEKFFDKYKKEPQPTTKQKTELSKIWLSEPKYKKEPQPTTKQKTELSKIWLSEPRITIDSFLQLGVEKGIWNEQYNIITAKGSLYGTGKSLLGSLSIALRGYSISKNTDYKEVGKAFCNTFNIPIKENTKQPYKAFGSGNGTQITEFRRSFNIR